MKIKRTCLYCGTNWNLLPTILVTPKEDGFCVAFKWLKGHAGVYVQTKQFQGEYIAMNVHPVVEDGNYYRKLTEKELLHWQNYSGTKVFWTVYGVKKLGLVDVEEALVDCTDEVIANVVAWSLRNHYGIED